MTIGHPQSPYPKWFSGSHRSEDTKHWLRSDSWAPVCSPTRRQLTTLPRHSRYRRAATSSLVDHGPRRSDISISSIFSPVLSVCA
ncbi:hypothetical protein IFM47457_09436 [Aspergillus lentulus]|nr:hypothetical protein IFM47457_09436 [Aspergillus lentulus]